MKLLGLIVLSLLTAALSVDWYVCFIKQQCEMKSAPVVLQKAQALEGPVQVETLKTDTDDKIAIIKGRIHFKSGATKILKSQKIRSHLKKIAIEWAKNKDQKLVITGHTDNRGSRKDNYRLGLFRSKSIKKALTIYGVDENAISVKSMGESKPLSSNRTRKGRFYNRRVEINFK